MQPEAPDRPIRACRSSVTSKQSAVSISGVNFALPLPMLASVFSVYHPSLSYHQPGAVIASIVPYTTSVWPPHHLVVQLAVIVTGAAHHNSVSGKLQCRMRIRASRLAARTASGIGSEQCGCETCGDRGRLRGHAHKTLCGRTTYLLPPPPRQGQPFGLFFPLGA